MQNLEKVEKRALQLSESERKLLAEKLFSSLKLETMNDVDEAWIEEIERRYDQYKIGQTQPMPATRVFEDIKKGMGWGK